MPKDKEKKLKAKHLQKIKRSLEVRKITRVKDAEKWEKTAEGVRDARQESDDEQDGQDEDEKQDKDDEKDDQKEDAKDDIKDAAKDKLKDKAKDWAKDKAKKISWDRIKAGLIRAGKAIWQGLKAVGARIVAGLAAVIEAIGLPALIVILIIILLLVLFYVASLVTAGTSPTTLPDIDNESDRLTVAETACWSGDCGLAQNEAKDMVADITKDLEDTSAYLRGSPNYVLAVADDQEKTISEEKTELNKVIKSSEILETNSTALAQTTNNSGAALRFASNDIKSIQKAIETINGIPDYPNKKEVLANLAEAEEYHARIIKSLTVMKVGKEKAPILRINQLDQKLIKDFKIDLRLLKLLNYLADRSQVGGQLNALELTISEIRKALFGSDKDYEQSFAELFRPNKEWSVIEISRLTQFDPESVEAQVTTESDANHSAHYGGKAADISVVGNYKCKKKGLFSSKTFWPECKVAYQTDYRPAGLNSYAMNPTARDLSGIMANPFCNGGDCQAPSSGEDIDQIIMNLGIAELADQLDIDPQYFRDGSFDIKAIGSAFLESSANLPPGVISNFFEDDQPAPEVIGRTYLEELLGLSSGSLDGDSYDQILSSVGYNHLKSELGLEQSDWNGKFDDKSIGKARLEAIYRTEMDSETIRNKISENPSQFLRRTGLKKKVSPSQAPATVGRTFKEQLFQAQNPVGLSRSIGLFDSAINQLMAGGDIYQEVGSIVLARTLSIDPREKPRKLSMTRGDYKNEQAIRHLIEQLDFQLPLGVDRQDLATILLAPDDQTRDQLLDELGDQIIERGVEAYVDPLVKETIRNLTGVDYYQVGAEDIVELFNDEEKLEQFALDIGRNGLNDVLARYQPTLFGYEFSEYDAYSILDGDWQSVVARVGGAKIESEVGLPADIIVEIVGSDVPTDEAIKRGGLSIIMQRLGINIEDIVFHEDWFGQDTPTLIGQAMVESLGLGAGTFGGTVEDIIGSNGMERTAAALGLTKEELGQVINRTAETKLLDRLHWVDSALGLNHGSTQALLTDEVSTKQYAESVSFSNLVDVHGDELARLLDIDPELFDLGGNLWELIQDPENNEQALYDLLSGTLDRVVDDRLGWPTELFLAQITNDDSAKEKALDAGFDYLARTLAQGNRKQTKAIRNLISAAYESGGEINRLDVYRFGSEMLGLDFVELENKEPGVMFSFFNGNIDIGINIAQKEIFYDKSQSLLVLQYIDDQIEKITGLSTSEIIDLRDGWEDWNDGDMSNGDMLTLVNDSFEIIDPLIIKAVKGEATPDEILDGLIAPQLGNMLGVDPDTLIALKDSYLAFREGGISGVDFYTDMATTLGVIDPEIGQAIKFFQDTVYGGQAPDAGFYSFIAYELGIGTAIDDTVGVNGFTSGLITGLMTGNWIPLGLSIVGSIFGIGEVTCQDAALVAQEHVRDIVAWSLEMPPDALPLQVIVFKEEDMNFFNGLDENGEPDASLPNYIEYKYGPKSSRGNQGLFTSDHMWNHVHIGY